VAKFSLKRLNKNLNFAKFLLPNRFLLLNFWRMFVNTGSGTSGEKNPQNRKLSQLPKRKNLQWKNHLS
jgi:hypothetical protein